MPSQLEQRIAQFTEWRTKLVAAIDDFRSWQDTYGHADIEQTLRIYDMVEGLRNDRIRLAFMVGTVSGWAAVSNVRQSVGFLFRAWGRFIKAGRHADSSTPAAPVAPAAPANPFGAEQHPKASMRAVPPTFLNESEPDMGNGSAFLAKYWDAK